MKGQTVSHYVVLEELGAGGNAVVYRAEDLALQREVALKFLSADVSNYAGVARFQHEARTASSLSHPNICAIYEIGEHEGRHFLAMELLEGKVLSYVISGRPIDTYRLVELAMQIVDALEAAHAAGIVHRDIKPGNVFVTTRDQVKLLDFGLAFLMPRGPAARGARRGALPAFPGGTVPYMSPEQVRGDEIDHRTDLFSLGTVLYEMATGGRPFNGPTPQGVMDAILNFPPLPAREINPALPAELDRIIDKALEKNRKLRFQTASDLQADLRRLKRELDSVTTVHNRGRGPAQKSEAPRSRRAPLGAVVGGLAIAGGALLVAGVVKSRSNETSTTETRHGATGRDLQLEADARRSQMTAATPIAPAAAPSRTATAPAPGAPAKSSRVAAAAASNESIDEIETAPPPATRSSVDREPEPPRSTAPDDLKIARQKIELKLYDQALETLRRVAQNASRRDAVDASFLIASIHETRGSVDDAMSAYLEVASRHPDDPRAPEALMRLAESMLRSKRRERDAEARRTLTEIVAKYPASPWAPLALLLRGDVEERMNLHQRDDVLNTSVPTALVTYRELVQRYRSSSAAATALNKLAHSYAGTRRFDLAARTFEELAARDSENHFDAWFAAGDVYEKRLKDSERAKSAYSRVPPTSERYPEAQKRLRK